jgi:hypothetical protein
MDIKKADRATLKAYFRKNLVPTESNFADFIDGMLNQKDDGIAKLPGDPLSIAAEGQTAGPQKVINFYANLADINPAWTLQLNPRTDQNNPATARSGFSIGDGQSNLSRLFIDASTGNVGIGTITPNGSLDVAGYVRIAMNENGSGSRSISFARDGGDDPNAGKIAYRPVWGPDALNVMGAGPSGSRKVRLWDNAEVAGHLSAMGSLGVGTANPAPNARLTVIGGALALGASPQKADAAIHVSASFGGFDRLLQMGPSTASKPGLNLLASRSAANADQWWAWGVTVDNAWRIQTGTSFAGQDGLTITPAGNVGIGTTQPATPLHIVTKTGAEATGYGNPMAWGQHIEFAATGMWGLSNSYGILHTWESDSLFIGLKEEGPNRKDSIIAFGDDAGDTLRFLFVPGGNATPVECLKITSAGNLRSPMWNVTQVFNNRQGGLPFTSGAFTTGGGTLLIIASGSGWGNGNIGMSIQLNNSVIGYARSFTNEPGSHKVFNCNALVVRKVAAGSHTITLSALAGTNTDVNDWFNVTVLELPF